MKTTKRFLYGFWVLRELAQDREKHHSARLLAEQLGIPETLARQILMRLRKTGFLEAEKGRVGGYRLARTPEKIPLIAVMKALTNGEPDLSLLGGGRIKPVELGKNDPTARFWNYVEEKFWGILKERTLADLLGH
jgi:Rrf2 family protein